MKVLPLFVLSLMVFGCGGSGDPDGLADSIKDDIISESFDSLFDYHMDWEKEKDEGKAAANAWRHEEGYEKWKTTKEKLEKLDPKDKSEIADSKDKWAEASDAERYAVRSGVYLIYEAEDWEERLKEGLWYKSSRSVEYGLEGQARGSVSYKNKYGDSIRVSLYRENGSWYLSSVTVDMPKDKPKKPKDD